MLMRVAMIGAGQVAEVHAHALGSIQDIDFMGFYERSSAVRAKRIEEWGVLGFGTMDDLLASDADAVLILTHLDSHFDIAKQALMAGKHVFIEKPVAATAREVREIAEIARERKLVAMPGNNYAYNPEFARMQRLVRAGDLGEIRALSINYVIKHPESVIRDYTGVLESIMNHHAYLSVALLGTPRRVVGGAPETGWESHPHEDQGWMTLDYGKATAHLFCTQAVDDFSNTPWTFVVKVLGTEGTAVVDWRTSVFTRPLGTLPIAIVQYEESFANELLAFVAAVEQAEPLISSMEDAATAVEITSAAHRSMASGRWELLVE